MCATWCVVTMKFETGVKKNAAAKNQKRAVPIAAASPGPSSGGAALGAVDRALADGPRDSSDRGQEQEPGAHPERRHRRAPSDPVDQERRERREQEDAEPHPRRTPAR